MSDLDSKENEEEIVTETTEVETSEETVVDENGPVNVGHQDNDLDLKTVKKFIVVSFAVTIAFFVLMLIVLRFYKTDFEEERGVANVEDRQIPGKDDALLQTEPLVELAEYNDLETLRLTMTTNAVEHAVIPVEAAKKLMLAENAFPTPASVVVTEDVSEPMESMVSFSPAPAKQETVIKSEPTPQEPVLVALATTPEVEMVTEPAPDPRMVAAGEKIFTAQCMVCHSGKKGAIGPNMQKAYGTMRKIENHDPILMDHDYIINSMNNPMDHIAKGYMPVMMSFKELLTTDQKEEVVAYLKSQGTLISKAVPKPVVAVKPEPELTVEAPVQVMPVMEKAPAKLPAPVIEQPIAPEVEEQPAAPVDPQPKEENKGIIFV
jgi:mono/diheme cytochrome c family protein